MLVKMFLTGTIMVGAVAGLDASSPIQVPVQSATAGADTAVTRWVVDTEGNEARYRVREQLAGFDFPNDAVGVTDAVTGSVTLDASGVIVPDGSSFVVDLASLRSDSERRDGYVRRRTLEVETFPEAVLRPLKLVGLLFPLPPAEPVRFRLHGDLTVHGITRPTVWEVTAQQDGRAITGQATTAFPFAEFGIAVPSVARVLSVDDNIRLEFDFRLVPSGR